jgi:hypothetical protein
VAPAGGARNPALGRPWVPVRPHYEGLPSMAGRGWDEGGRKPAGCGRLLRPFSPSPEERARGQKSRRWSAGRRLSPIARREETPSQGVSGGRADRPGSRSQGFRVSRRSAPLGFGERFCGTAAYPAPVKEYGRRRLRAFHAPGCLTIEDRISLAALLRPFINCSRSPFARLAEAMWCLPSPRKMAQRRPPFRRSPAYRKMRRRRSFLRKDPERGIGRTG